VLELRNLLSFLFLPNAYVAAFVAEIMLLLTRDQHIFS